MTLRSRIVAVADLEPGQIEAMYGIYRLYYTPAPRTRFLADLKEKDAVVALEDEAGTLRGFSTLRTWRIATPNGPVRLLFSGDTIIERAFWGTQALAFGWIECAGAIKRGDPATPLYWFLISKGHRTYRYLAAFAQRFYPTFRETTPAWISDLMHTAAAAKFGASYARDRGIVVHDATSPRLMDEFVGADRHAANTDVQFFLEKNPGYAEGDELVCLCELSADNLKPIARRQFLRGYSAHPLDEVA